MKILKKVLITLLTLLFTAMTVMNAYALSGDPNAWKYKLSQAGSKTTINATKNGFKSAIKVVAPTAKVATKLGRMANTAMFALAVADIIGDGVQWLYDEGTKTVKYKKEKDNKCDCTYLANLVYGWNPSDVEQISIKDEGYKYVCKVKKDGFVSTFDAPFKHKCQNQKEQNLTLEQLAEQVKKLADKDNADAKKLLQQIVQELAEQKAYDDELERAKVADTEADPQAKDLTKENEKTKDKEKDKEKEQENEKTKDKPFELPDFCSWSGICESTHKTAEKTTETSEKATEINDKLNDVKENTKETAENSKSIKQRIDEFFDFFTKKEEIKDSDADIDIDGKKPDKQASDFDKDYIRFGGQCPTFTATTVKVGTVSKDITYDMTPLCQFAEKVRPAILAMAYLFATGVIASAIRNT